MRGRRVINQPPSAKEKRWERRGAWDVALFTVAASGYWLLALLVLRPDVKVAVIPTLTLLAARHFKHGKQEDEHAPKHPAVKFLLGAWNEGDFSEAENYVAPDLAMSINGFTSDSTPEGDGPAMARTSIEYWRAIVPDIKMNLIQEIREKDRIAIDWLITGTHTGERPELPASGNSIELQGAALLTLEDDKIVQVSTVFDALALAVQTEAVEAPAWWPGRGHAS
ncbi:MAG: ester cyclase [Actinomycetota bacterium]